MPMIPFVPTETRRRRILNFGPPNHWKTTAILTMPAPRAIVNSPGEKGYTTLEGASDTSTFIWEYPEDKRPDSYTICKQVEDACMECITGKHGKLATFAFEGVHKYFEFIADKITDGAWFGGEDFEPKQYARIYRACDDFLSRILHCSLPVVCVTAWDGREGDRPAKPGEKASDIPRHVWPEGPGKVSKRMLGEFDTVVYSVKRRPDPNEQKRWGYQAGQEVIMWQTRPWGEVLGVGLKGPKAIVEQIPTWIPADYTWFEREWERAELMAKKGAI